MPDNPSAGSTKNPPVSPNRGEESAAPTVPSGTRKKLLTIGIVGGIMAVEGVGIFMAVKMTHAPAAGEAAETVLDPLQLIERMDPELPVAECDAINRRAGQSILVHLIVSIRVAADQHERAVKLIEKRQSTIKDRVQMILRSADPQHLNEANLDTLKRQVKFELDKVLEDDQLVLEVLIPQILQSPSRL